MDNGTRQAMMRVRIKGRAVCVKVFPNSSVTLALLPFPPACGAHRRVRLLPRSCLYGTDYMAGEVGKANASSATQTLWGIAGGIVVGAVAAGAAGWLSTSVFAKGGDSWRQYRVGGNCRTR